VTRRRGPSPGLGPRGSSEWPGTHPCEGTGGFPVAGSRRACQWAARGPEEEALPVRVRAGIWRPRLVTVELTRDPGLSSGPPRRAVPACPGPAPMGDDAPGWRPGAASRVPSVTELATHIRVSHRLGGDGGAAAGRGRALVGWAKVLPVTESGCQSRWVRRVGLWARFPGRVAKGGPGEVVSLRGGGGAEAQLRARIGPMLGWAKVPPESDLVVVRRVGFWARCPGRVAD
jgi:hypothetical protein